MLPSVLLIIWMALGSEFHYERCRMGLDDAGNGWINQRGQRRYAGDQQESARPRTLNHHHEQ